MNKEVPQEIKRSRSVSGGKSGKGIKNTTPHEKANEIIGYCRINQIPLPLKNAFAVKILWNEMTGKQMNNETTKKVLSLLKENPSPNTNP